MYYLYYPAFICFYTFLGQILNYPTIYVGPWKS